MNTLLSSSQLKSLAKGQLMGNYATAISAELSVAMCLFILYFVTGFAIDNTTPTGLVISYLVTFILDILSSIFVVGLARFYLNLVCGHPFRVTDAFSGFTSHADKAISVRFLIMVLQGVCVLPTGLLALLYVTTHSSIIFLIACILGAISGVLCVMVWLLYSQVYYLILDFPEYTTRKLMQFSRQIMRGHKGQLFYLCISLIPVYLLGVISCGIAFLWIIPYKNCTLTNFYLNLMRNDNS